MKFQSREQRLIRPADQSKPSAILFLRWVERDYRRSIPPPPRTRTNRMSYRGDRNAILKVGMLSAASVCRIATSRRLLASSARELPTTPASENATWLSAVYQSIRVAHRQGGNLLGRPVTRGASHIKRHFCQGDNRHSLVRFQTFQWVARPESGKLFFPRLSSREKRAGRAARGFGAGKDGIGHWGY